MKSVQSCLASLIMLFVFTNGTQALQLGDSLSAVIFVGSETNTALGNPNVDGQGWYRKDLTTKLNYYDDVQPRWATAVVKTGGSFSEVKTNSVGALAVSDAYSGALGIAWVYTNGVYGKYAISCDKLVVWSYLRAQFVTRSNSQEAWVALSEVYGPYVTLNNLSFTNTLGAGGGIALKLYNSNSNAADASGNVSGLKVTFLENATQTPTVSLSASTGTLQENPNMQSPAAVVVKAQVSELSSRDTTVSLVFSGTATLGTDYMATTNQVVIPAGMSYADVTLKSKDDALVEGTETISVSLGTLENATAGAVATVAVSLPDDDVPLSESGDVLRARIFFGSEDNTTGGNPNPSGQAWYRKNLTTPLNSYFSGSSTSKWATASVNTGSTYSHVTTSSLTNLYMEDRYSGQLGLGWVYTNSVSGWYSISCTKVSGSYIKTEFLVKSSGSASWVSLSGVQGTLASGYASTNWLNKGGGLAFKIYNSNAAVAPMTATVSDLQVVLVETLPKQTVIIVR